MSHGRLEDLSQSEFPTLVWAWTGDRLAVDQLGTHFGFVYGGPAVLRCSAGIFPLKSGMYFAVPGELSIEQGSGMIVSRLGFRGLFHLGGPVEDLGRLRYINGCTDSLLIPPVTLGDPCLNLLHLPPDTRQSAHTHPSLRGHRVPRRRFLRDRRTLRRIIPRPNFCHPPRGAAQFSHQTLFTLSPGLSS